MSFDSSNRDAPPGIGAAAVTLRWRDLLYRRLANQPTPVVLFGADVRSAASLWAGVREWSRRLRAFSLRPGDRVLLWHDDPAVLLQLLVATLWEGLSLQIASAATDDAVMAMLAADRESAGHTVLVVSAARRSRVPQVAGHHVIEPAAGGWPLEAQPLHEPIRPRPAAPDDLPTPLLLLADGSAGCTHAELLEEADGWATALGLAEGRVLVLGAGGSVAGVTGALLAPLLYADELFVGEDDADTVALVATEPLTHVLDAGRQDSAVVASALAGRVAVNRLRDRGSRDG